ncbi:endonuclease-reverse transcriptase-domain-containing protein, partial [Choanephora cucurbitarum]
MSNPSSASLVVSSVSSGSPAAIASPSGPVSKWATVAAAAPVPAPTPGEAYGKSKKSVSSSPSGAAVQAKPKVKVTSRHRKAAARIFVVSSPPAGSPVDGPLFEYVYLPNKYRARLSVFRQKLRLIGLDNSRVLDVHYPARNVVALLIHTAYKENLLKVLNKYSLPVLTDFDPFSVANVRDPSFASLDSDALTAKARELQQARLVRALGYIREQTRRLVAYDFVRQGWLSKEQAFSAIGSPSPVSAISTVTDYLYHSSLIFITETWLLPPLRFPTSWQQYHTYGQPVADSFRGKMGISLLVNPTCPYPVTPLLSSSPYVFSCQVSTFLIHCVYAPPSLSDDEFMSLLLSLPSRTHASQTNAFICGDLNARSVPLLGDSRSNTRGTCLAEWIEEAGLFCWNSLLAKGAPTLFSPSRMENAQPGHSSWSSVIDLFISFDDLVNPSLVDRDAGLDSDHVPVSLSCSLSSLPPAPVAHPRLLWKLSCLDDH